MAEASVGGWDGSDLSFTRDFAFKSLPGFGPVMCVLCCLVGFPLLLLKWDMLGLFPTCACTNLCVSLALSEGRSHARSVALLPLNSRQLLLGHFR